MDVMPESARSWRCSLIVAGQSHKVTPKARFVGRCAVAWAGFFSRSTVEIRSEGSSRLVGWTWPPTLGSFRTAIRGPIAVVAVRAACARYYSPPL